MFFTAMIFFGFNALKCVSMNNQKCKARPEIININCNEPLFYPYVAKGINAKVFNLMSRTNKTRYIGWHKTCRCNCL